MTISKQHAATQYGDIAYTTRGAGPCALFVHGLFMNGYLWRHVIERVSDLRRCVAIDLLAHGATRTQAGADLSFKGQAEMLEAFCASLGVEQVDLVANDSGGGIAQIFAARHPERIRSLTLTNCDAHTNWPPPAFAAVRKAVAEGKLARMMAAMLSDISFARSSFAIAYERPEFLTEEAIREYVTPLAASPESVALLEQWFKVAHDNQQTVEIEPLLRELRAPTQILWGTADPFFDVEWAHWLKRTIPGARRVIELEGAKLFHPEERPDVTATALRELWTNPDALSGPA
jgi:pimeloyl-ACP methyl ester carboxylesterase